MDIKDKIRRYGLRSGAEREVSLLTSSCVALGYTKYLEKNFGLHYDAFCAIGRGFHYRSFLNERSISEKVERKLREQGYETSHDRQRAQEIHSRYRDRIKNIEEKNVPTEKAIKVILEGYSEYFSSLGYYNCLWRLSKENPGFVTTHISGNNIAVIGSERNAVSALYPQIENLLRSLFQVLREVFREAADLFFFTTKTELLSILDKGLINQETKDMIEMRSQQYLHFYEYNNDKERVVTSPELISSVEVEYFHVGQHIDASEILGVAAFPGVVRGRVSVLQEGEQNINGKKEIAFDTVLVAKHTHPKYTHLVKQCAAIVADEGGILSHAAIIASELKKPCIIGTKIATQVLKDGDLVEVDANEGVVRILERST